MLQKNSNKVKNNKKPIKIRKFDLFIKSLKKLNHFFFKTEENK
jgi:hypothetical protein